MTDKSQHSFLEIPTQSSAQIISRNEVEVVAPDGEVFTVLCQIGAYTSKETQDYELHWLEVLFDKNFSDDKEEMTNPNNVKVVTDKNGYALYFSRSLMPYPREDTGVTVYKHIGIYAYKRDFLLNYAKMEPTPLEKTESLEQLRALENGFRIKVIETEQTFVGVDTAEDLAKVNEIYKNM